MARTSAPWVTSGSSPASLTTPAVARSPSSSSTASANAGVCPFGSVMVTGSGKSPVSRAVYAAVVAAVAQAPVVQPGRSPVCLSWALRPPLPPHSLMSWTDPMHVLVLGGTTEARRLAESLAGDAPRPAPG